MLTNEEKDRIATYRPHYVAKTSNELLLELKCNIAIEALEKIRVIYPAIYDGMTAMNFKIIASNALKEIEEVK